MMFFEAAEMVELFKENMDEASAALVVWSAQLPTLSRKTNNIKKHRTVIMYRTNHDSLPFYVPCSARFQEAEQIEI